MWIYRKIDLDCEISQIQTCASFSMCLLHSSYSRDYFDALLCYRRTRLILLMRVNYHTVLTHTYFSLVEKIDF